MRADSFVANNVRSLFKTQEKLCQPVRTRVQIKPNGEIAQRKEACHVWKYLQYKT